MTTTAHPEPQDSTSPVTKKETDIPVDSLGRPLQDNQGRWITYPDGSSHRKSRLYPSYDDRTASTLKENETTLKSFDKSAFSKAVQSKAKFDKTGKLSDYIEYQQDQAKVVGREAKKYDTSAARDADRAMEQYVKTGNKSDLDRYKKESKRALRP